MRPAANAAYLPECVKHSGRWYQAETESMPENEHPRTHRAVAPDRVRCYSCTFSTRASSPTIPRRKASTQATKIAPWMIVTHAPNWAR